MFNSASRAKIALAIVAAVFALCSFGLGPLMDACNPMDRMALLVFACVGIIGGAALLLAIWGAIGAGAPGIRLSWTFGTGLLLYCLVILGAAWSDSTRNRSFTDNDWRGVFFTMLLLPLVFLTLQAPLWLVRLLFRWRIELVRSPTKTLPLQSATIRDMLVATGVIGVALACGRSAGLLVDGGASQLDPEFWSIVAVFLAFIGGLSLATTLPIVAATLRARRLARATAVLAIYCAMWPAIVVTTNRLLGNGWPDRWIILCLSTAGVSYTASVTIVLLLARQIGYRLLWGRSARNSAYLAEWVKQPVTGNEGVLSRTRHDEDEAEP